MAVLIEQPELIECIDRINHIRVSVEEFRTNDIVTINFNDNLKIKCIVVDIIDGIATFISLNTVFDMPLSFDGSKCKSWLESDLREYLNLNFYDNCYPFMQDKLVKDDNLDYFSIPSEKEIFGINKYGEDEDDRSWPIMKYRRRYRMGLDNDENLNWYWLRTKRKNSSAYFCRCNDFGDASYSNSSRSGGVRLRFFMPQNEDQQSTIFR